MRQDSPPATLVFVRHGHSRPLEGPYRADSPLTALGRDQAEAVALALEQPSLSAIYASPWPRAHDTAKPLCRQLGTEPVLDDALVEYALEDLVESHGSLPEERPDLAIWRAEDRGSKNGETLGEFAERVGTYCERISRRHVGERVALFSHSGTIDAAIRWAMGVPYSTPWHSDMPLHNASITEIVYWPDGRVGGGAPRYGAFVRVGDVAHLGDLHNTD